MRFHRVCIELHTVHWFKYQYIIELILNLIFRGTPNFTNGYCKYGVISWDLNQININGIAAFIFGINLKTIYKCFVEAINVIDFRTEKQNKANLSNNSKNVKKSLDHNYSTTSHSLLFVNQTVTVGHNIFSHHVCPKTNVLSFAKVARWKKSEEYPFRLDSKKEDTQGLCDCQLGLIQTVNTNNC